MSAPVEPGTAWTPGPWRFSERNGERIVVGAVGEGVALIPHLNFGLVDPAEREANARLIAAAPQLVAALEAIVRNADELDRVALPIGDAEAALRLATGESA